MDQGTTYDVFVSHNGRDKPIVELPARLQGEALGDRAGVGVLLAQGRRGELTELGDQIKE